jgi:hypothetical protein
VSIPIPTLIIGGVSISPTRHLPSTAFTAVAKKSLSFQRSQNGKLYSQRNYEKYSVKVQGLSQTLYEDLRYEYCQDAFIDLYSIANRKELFIANGATSQFLTSRRIRTDDGNTLATTENPVGTVVSATYAVATGGTQGLVTITGSTPSNGSIIAVKYFPIINGQIVEMDSDYDWINDTESWSLRFEEA